jgi:hypothetical protein
LLLLLLLLRLVLGGRCGERDAAPDDSRASTSLAVVPSPGDRQKTARRG